MNIDYDSENPIFLQIAAGIEDAILSKAFDEEMQIPSITEFAVMFKINPATALKGVNLLVENGILYKKRGVGMFVAQGALEALKEKRKEAFYNDYIVRLFDEAKTLGINKEEIIGMIELGFTK